MHDVRCVWQSGDVTIVAGDRWAIVREQPTGDDVVSQFFIREQHWTLLTGVSGGQAWADPDTIFDLAVSLRAMRVYDLSIRQRMAMLADEIGDALVDFPSDAPIEALDWDQRMVFRIWCAVRGNVTTVLMVEEGQP